MPKHEVEKYEKYAKLSQMKTQNKEQEKTKDPFSRGV